MHDSGILDGDLLAVHRTLGADRIARISEEVTVKRYAKHRNQVRLLPENPDFSPIVRNLKRDSLVIEGIGVGVIRNDRAL